MSMQQLILPINKAKLTASWKTAAYIASFGCVHYGVDLISSVYDRTLYASGDGIVVAAGADSVVGLVVVVRYTDAHHRATAKSQDVIFRYFHLDSIRVKAGQAVNKDTVLGVYGSTGLLGTGAHLHLEADTDIAWPRYSPTVWNSSLLRGRVFGANDSTMTNPLEWLHCKASLPDSQTWTTAGDHYIRPEDRSVAKHT